jgi:hypothetical protein
VHCSVGMWEFVAVVYRKETGNRIENEGVVRAVKEDDGHRVVLAIDLQE